MLSLLRLKHIGTHINDHIIDRMKRSNRPQNELKSACVKSVKLGLGPVVLFSIHVKFKTIVFDHWNYIQAKKYLKW